VLLKNRPAALKVENGSSRSPWLLNGILILLSLPGYVIAIVLIVELALHNSLVHSEPWATRLLWKFGTATALAFYSGYLTVPLAILLCAVRSIARIPPREILASWAIAITGAVPWLVIVWSLARPS
jgi:hypothetical protein